MEGTYPCASLNKADDPEQHIDIEEENHIEETDGMLSPPCTHIAPALKKHVLALSCSIGTPIQE